MARPVSHTVALPLGPDDVTELRRRADAAGFVSIAQLLYHVILALNVTDGWQDLLAAVAEGDA